MANNQINAVYHIFAFSEGSSFRSTSEIGLRFHTDSNSCNVTGKLQNYEAEFRNTSQLTSDYLLA